MNRRTMQKQTIADVCKQIIEILHIYGVDEGETCNAGALTLAERRIDELMRAGFLPRMLDQDGTWYRYEGITADDKFGSAAINWRPLPTNVYVRVWTPTEFMPVSVSL